MTCEEDCDYYDHDRCAWNMERPKGCTCQLPRALRLDELLKEKK